MAAVMEPAKARLERRLREAHLRDDRDCVAFWTDAIKSWEQPIPDYGRSDLNQFSLDQRLGSEGREFARNGEMHDWIFTPKKARRGGAGEG